MELDRTHCEYDRSIINRRPLTTRHHGQITIKMEYYDQANGGNKLVAIDNGAFKMGEQGENV